MIKKMKKETAIQDEQQLKIVDIIINIMADNNLSIAESKMILDSVLRKLEQQKVTNDSTGWIDANIVLNRKFNELNAYFPDGNAKPSECC